MKAKTEPKPSKKPIPGTKFTIAISSAKGGVGKSTFATNLTILKKLVKSWNFRCRYLWPSLPKLFSIYEK